MGGSSACRVTLGGRRRAYELHFADVTVSDAAPPKPRAWLVLADLEHAPDRCDFGPGAPANNESARERGIREIDRNGVVQHAAQPGWCHYPAISTAVLVEPRGHLRMPHAETAG